MKPIAGKSAQNTVKLDLRGLPPPLPMQRILEALDDMQDGIYLDAKTPFWPLPLVDRLQNEGYHIEGSVEAAGDAVINIWRDSVDSID